MRHLTIALSVAALALGVECAAWAQATQPAGSVVIAWHFERRPHVASNQVAVWIEDANGRFIRTVYITDFNGRRKGWKKRAPTLQDWVKASNAANTPQSQIDAVSRATPSSGPVSVTWDLKDSEGKAVPAGTYRYKVEGSIIWEKGVLWTGTIRVGGAADSSNASATYFPSGAGLEGKMITSVTAQFIPGPTPR